MNSMGSLKQQTKYVNFTPITQSYWMSMTGFKANATVQSFNLTNIDGNVWATGVNGSSSTGKLFAYTDSSATGAISSYKVLNGVLSASTGIKGYASSNSGNKYYLLSNFTIVYYDSSGTYIDSPRFFDSLGGSLTVNNMYKGSGNYIYVLFNSNTLCKIDLASLTATWCVSINTIVANSGYLHMDSAENLYVCVYTTSGSVNTIFKFNSSGTLQWQYGTSSFSSNLNNRIDVDSSGNVWLLGNTSPGIIVKLNSSGVYQSARSVPTFDYGLGGSYRSLCVNSNGNIVIIQDLPAGADDYTVTVTINNSYTVLNTTRIDQGFGSVLIVPKVIMRVGDSIYIGASTDPTGANLITLLKLPADNDLIFSVPFSYSYTRDDSTTFSASGTLNSTNQTNPVLSVTTMTFGSTSYTTSSFTFTTSTLSVTNNSTIPYSTQTTIS